jgi:hypothetical protein
MKQSNMLVTTTPGADASIGMHKREIDTPALLLDLPAMEQNLQRMAAFTAARRTFNCKRALSA